MDIPALPFGTQYLRGCTPAPGDWDRDLAVCRANGMDTVRAWLVWGVLEPRPGKIDASYLDRWLAAVARAGLRTGLLFHLHGCPEWAARAHRDCWYVDADGRAVEPAPRTNTPSGGWPGLCPDHAQVQELEERFMSAVLRQVGDHPAVAFWEPVNEPHQWIDWTRTPAAAFCFCPATRAAFAAWLERRYGTLAALEQAWGRRLSCWADARPDTWRCGIADAVDFRLFTTESTAALVARRAAIIRRQVRAPVAAHAWGGGCTACHQLGAMAFDDWRNAQAVDIWGYSAFPSRPQQLSAVGLGTVSTRCAARGKPFWQAELGSGDYGPLLRRQGRIDPALQAQFCWESLRQGAQGLLFWQYRKEAHGSEQGAYGLTGYGGQPTATLAAMARIGGALARHRDLFLAARPLPAQVALVFSLRTCLVEWAAERSSRITLDSLAGWFRACWDGDLPVDVVHDEFATAAELARYRALVLPNPLCLDAGLRALLPGFVAGGGHLISDPGLGLFTPACHLAPEAVPGDGLDALFGCRERDLASASDLAATLAWQGRALAVPRGHFRAAWDLLDGGAALAVYDDGEAAVVERRHGAGRTVISGVDLGLSCAPRQDLGDELARSGDEAGGEAGVLIRALLRQAGVEAPLGTPPPCRASLLPAGDGRALAVVLNPTAAPAAGRLALGRRLASARNLVDERDLAVDGDGVGVLLPPRGSLALELRWA